MTSLKKETLKEHIKTQLHSLNEACSGLIDISRILYDDTPAVSAFDRVIFDPG